MAQYVVIRRSSQVPMLMASDIDTREISSLHAEVMDILQQVFGARAGRVWQYPVEAATTALYYVLSLLSDKFTPGQAFCGIQMWFPMMKDSTPNNIMDLALYPLLSGNPEELARFRERATIVSISLLEALLPYLSFLAYVGVRAAKDLVNTIISDDSDVATVVTRSMNEEGHSHSIEGGDDRRGGSSTPNCVGNQGAPKWLHEISNGIRQCRSDPQFKWTASIFTHVHLWGFLVYGTYFSPVLRTHAVRLIRACRVEKISGSGSAGGKKGIADRINLKVLAWLVGSRLALLALYGTYRWLYRAPQTGATLRVIGSEATAGTLSYPRSTVSREGPQTDEDCAEQDVTEEPLVDKTAVGSELSSRSCPLCMDAVKHPVATRCGHLYCHICLHDLLRRRGTTSSLPNQAHARSGGTPCPVCRSSINAKELRHIYT